MLLSEETAGSSVSEIQTVLKLVVLWVHLDHHGLVCADVNPAIGVPSKLDESQVGVFVTILRRLQPRRLTQELLLASLVDVIGLVDGESVDDCLGEDTELHVVLWVELYRQEFVSFTG